LSEGNSNLAGNAPLRSAINCIGSSSFIQPSERSKSSANSPVVSVRTETDPTETMVFTESSPFASITLPTIEYWLEVGLVNRPPLLDFHPENCWRCSLNFKTSVCVRE
jgi:hypothetical protein